MAQSIGEQLKQARLQRELTIEQASQATHIRTFYLEALENDQRASLPSNVQGRGFLRLYADLLNLPAAPLLAAWDGKIPEEVVETPAEILPPVENAAGEAEATAAPDAAPPPPPQPETLPEPSRPAPEAPVTSSREVSESEQTSQRIFSEIGKKLRQQRETLGLSMTEVERYTRLRQHYIQALEDGRMEDLPSPVQGRGMLSNYAAFLNMNEDELLLRFAEGLQARRIERIPKAEPQGLFNQKKRPARQAPLWRRFLTPDLIFGVGVAAIILFFALWTGSRINSMRAVKAQPTPPGIAEILLTPQVTKNLTQAVLTPGSTALQGSSTTGVPGTPPPPAPSAETPLAPVDSGGAVGNPQPNVVDATFTPVSPATIPPMNKDPLQVYIVARERAWLRVVADEKVKFLGRTVPGNAYAFSGTSQIELRTGSGSALQVFFNQKDLGTLGNSGEVIDLIFSPDQLITTPTAAFTATPLPTKPATLTPLPSATPPATATITPFIPNP